MFLTQSNTIRHLSKTEYSMLREMCRYSNLYTGTFSGKRLKRGLYRSLNGQMINADVNGACNILRKSKQDFDFEELCRGLLASPLRIRVS